MMIQRYTPELNYSNSLATSMANVALRKDFEGVVILYADHEPIAKRVQELEEALRGLLKISPVYGPLHGLTCCDDKTCEWCKAREALRK